jgi:murein DD-endopeptidase MepM/ murein hydrolase activator NlpD
MAKTDQLSILTNEDLLKHIGWLIILIILFLAACAPQPASQTPVPVLPSTTSSPPQATATPQPSATPTPDPSPTPWPYLSQICSPLEGFTLADMPALVVVDNPYKAPQPGMDDGHHGVDLAFWSWPALGLYQMKGLPIHAVLEGTVVTINRDIYPYGYAVIIETPLEKIPPEWQSAWQLSPPAPLQAPPSALTCPQGEVPAAWGTSPLSIYSLYAHMDQPPAVQPGQTIECGQTIGVVGTTGLSVNDHLHFEVRLGPAGAQFASLGHYETSTSEEERFNYCTWRISGWFQLVNPHLVLTP